MTLTCALATRGRPELLRRTLALTLPNVADRGTRIVVLVDDDDEAMCGFKVDDPRVIVATALRADSLGEKYNRALRVAPADVYLAMVDYAPHVTPWFDAKILRAASLFPDRIGVVYNHMANPLFPQINAVTARWAEITGGIYTGTFPYWYVDNWLDDLARPVDRIAGVDVDLDVSLRPGTQEKREPAFWAGVYQALVFERRAIIERLIHEIDEPSWRKALMRSRINLTEERSHIHNEAVKRQPPKEFTADDWYMGVRGRALVKLQEIAQRLAA